MDAFGNRVFWAGQGITAKPKQFRIITMADIDIQKALNEIFQTVQESNIEEYDIFLELGKIGFQLKDLENTTYYDMAAEYTKTHDWEE